MLSQLIDLYPSLLYFCLETYLGDSKGRKGVMKCSNPRGPRPPKTLRNLWPLVKYTTSSVMTFLLASLGVVPDSTLLVRNIWFFSPLVPSKREKNILVLLS